MTPRELSIDVQQSLVKTLKNYFPETFPEEKKIGPMPTPDVNWENAAPLLAQITTDRTLAKTLKNEFNLLKDSRYIIQNLNEICDLFTHKGLLQEEKIANPYWYRLPIIMGEYPRHTKVINKAIKTFNQLIENFHKTKKEIDSHKLNEYFLEVVVALKNHGAYCFQDSLTDLINMMHGYSCIKMNFEIDKKKEEIKETKNTSEIKSIKPKKERITIIPAIEKNKPASSNPFIEQSIYPINSAGRLAEKSVKLLDNGFGLKFGGHFDALLTKTPSLIPVEDFYAVLWRELSQRMELPDEESLDAVTLRGLLLTTLKSLGMVIEEPVKESEKKEYFISPFSTQPQSFMTPHAIQKLLTESAKKNPSKVTDEEILTLSDYLSQLINRMQFNSGISLGIGANDDDTVSFSNEGRDYFFQFLQNESEWTNRFIQNSLHRQGPAQPHMNAAKGIQHELVAAFMTESKRIGELQRSEYEETIYNAIIDNLVTDLFPHPDFFENNQYKKYIKHFVLTKDELKQTHLTSYMEESPIGIFKENGQTTPKFRRPGTIDVHGLPKDHSGICEAFNALNSRNPLAAKQFQYAEALQGGTRGNYVYNPVGEDSFIADMFNGQTIKSSDGSYLPFIGVIPKNFDKEFKLSTELCASFVIRMLHSSRLMAYCPTFALNYQRIKSAFLPTKDAIPELPKSCSRSSFLNDKFNLLKESLDKNPAELSFKNSENLLASLFKNIIFMLRDSDLNDKTFKIFHHHLITDTDFLNENSRENFEKNIRILKINAPTKDENAYKDFMEKVLYLEKLIQSFYPTPSNETAKKMRELALKYQKPMTAHSDIEEYFTLMKKNPLINLSRNHSPATAFIKLKNETSLRQKKSIFDRMHQKNFISGYRDIEGSLVTNPTNLDQCLDYAAKGVAKFATSMQHDENPLGQIISAPFVGAYDGIKKNLESNDSNLTKLCTVPLGFAGGIVSGVNECGFKALSYGLKFAVRPGLRAKDAIIYCTSKLDTTTAKGKLALAGLFLPGLFGFLGGILESTAKLVYDCTVNPLHDFASTLHKKLNETKEYPLNEHSLYIKATPDNEPGFKIQISDKTRDILISYSTKEILIKKLREIASEIIFTAHPNFTCEEREIVVQQYLSENILNEKEWNEFHESFKECGKLGKYLDEHKELINNQLISATYLAFVERPNTRNQSKALEKINSVYKLLPDQKNVLNKLISYFNNHPDEQEQLIELFSETGEIRKKLQNSNFYSQKIHDLIMQIFNVENVKEALAQGYIHRFKASTPVKLTLNTFDKLPTSIQSQLKPEDLVKTKLKIQEDIKIASQMIVELKSELAEFVDESLTIEADIAKVNEEIEKCTQQLQNIEFFLSLATCIPTEDKLEKSSHEIQSENSSVLSLKDKAHLKWNQFATRELSHEFIAIKDINEIFALLFNHPNFQKSEMIKFKITNLKNHAHQLSKFCDHDNIDAFYDAYHQLLFASDSMQLNPELRNLFQFIEDFMNVMMNAAVNKTLDLYDEKQTENPLFQSRFIGQWLAKVAKSPNDFRSLLTQQLDQPLLHLTIIRQAYLIHALEKEIGITHKDMRIHKTGLQKLLRMHYLEQRAIKKSGAPHYETRYFNDFEEYLKKHGIDDSPTFHYANSRVKTKLGLFNQSHSGKLTQLASSLQPKLFGKGA